MTGSNKTQQQFDQIKAKSGQIKAKCEEITNICEGITSLSHKDPSQKELYGIYRDYIEHEDSLINNRLNWLLAAEGLIFYSYSTVVTDASQKCTLLFVLMLAGLSIGILGLAGILASILSINALKDKGKAHITSSKLPELTGGGDKRTESLGKFPQIGIPIIMILAWSILIVWRLLLLMEKQ